GLVASHGRPVIPIYVHGEVNRRFPLGGAGRSSRLRLDCKPVPVLHKQMTGVAQLSLLAFALSAQQRFGVSSRLMRPVRTFLAAEVDRRIARTIGRLLLVVRLPFFLLEA